MIEQKLEELERKTGLKLGRYYLGVKDNDERLLFQIISIGIDRFDNRPFCMVVVVDDAHEFNHKYVYRTSAFEFKYKHIRTELPEDITEEQAIIFYKSTIDNDDLYKCRYRELIW